MKFHELKTASLEKTAQRKQGGKYICYKMSILLLLNVEINHYALVYR